MNSFTPVTQKIRATDLINRRVIRDYRISDLIIGGMMDGFLRIKQIIPDIIPISRTTWWRGIKTGKYPQPVHLGARTTAWRKSDIQKLVEKFQEGI
jgi:prophage regulatory protein